MYISPRMMQVKCRAFLRALCRYKPDSLQMLQATFTDANTLTLTGVTSTAQFYGSGKTSWIDVSPL